MKLKIVNTGSAGNCYIFEASDKRTIIVELGVNFLDIKKALNFDLNNVFGALVTHEHQDHARSIKDATKAGINVYASHGTITASGVTNYRLHTIEQHKSFAVGPYTIYPFDVKHDAKEPLGFVISHPECGNVLFLTDTYYVDYKFENINNILIEANYSEEIIAEKRATGEGKSFLFNRVMKSHMSVETCKSYLNKMDLSGVNNIVLIHLSDKNAHAIGFKTIIQLATGKQVHVGAKGMELNFDKQPF
jgi:phosphoribosyl 1,2-cyclic phosphodiesterase